MSTYIEQLADAATDNTLPKIYPGMLSSGSLLEVDPMNADNPWASGVPANGASLYNAAWEQAAAIIGAGNSTTLAASFVDQHQTVDAVFERSGKGGLHAIYSQTAQSGSSSRGAAIIPAADILNYMLTTGLAHRYYLSIWHRVTRAGVLGQAIPPLFSGLFKTGDAGKAFEHFRANGFYGVSLGSYPASGLNSVGNVLRAMGFDGWNGGSPPADSTGLDAGIVIFGNYKSMATLMLNKSPSHVLYRVYLEDLTVSGRTYAEVLALDQQLYTEGVLTEGGRYYGDTYTDPSTKP